MVCSLSALQVQNKLIGVLGSSSAVVDMHEIENQKTPVIQLLLTIRPVISSIEKAKSMTELGISTPTKGDKKSI